MKNQDKQKHVDIREAAKILGIGYVAMRARVHRTMCEKRAQLQTCGMPKPKRVKYRGQYKWVFDAERLIKYKKSLNKTKR